MNHKEKCPASSKDGQQTVILSMEISNEYVSTVNRQIIQLSIYKVDFLI